MVRYAGSSPRFVTGGESKQHKKKREQKTIQLNKKFIKDMKHKCDYKIRCTYDEYCWMRNLLYYRRKKLGIKCRVEPMEGTEESLLQLIQMDGIKHTNRDERIAYNDGNLKSKNDNWDIADKDDLRDLPKRKA